MTALFRSPRTRRRTGDEGFTLIELLVVVVIIGVLIAIAVPLYNNYKKGAQNTAAQSDVRNGVTAIEAFYTANGNKYPDNNKTSGVGTPLKLRLNNAETGDQIAVSAGNKVRLLTQNTTTGATAPGYVICGWSSTGKNLYVYRSSTGETKKTPNQTDVTAADCKF